jgi:hypothetical protein
MDFDQVKRLALAAREFQFSHEGFTFTLRLPTQQEVDVAFARAAVGLSEEEDPAAMVKLKRDLLERSVIAWSGVTFEHLAAGGGAETPELSPEAVGLFLDNNVEAAVMLELRFLEERVARKKKQEDAAKN